MQGGIHPKYSGETYLDIVRAIRSVSNTIHIHAFSPLEIDHGRKTLNVSVKEFLTELKKAGLNSLPGTAAVEHKLGFIHANAGIDRSNIDQEQDIVLLLPENPDASAKVISQSLSQYFKKNVSVIITDTMGRPFRNGIVGFTIGSHNIECLLDERGKRDLYGNELKVTQIGIADELAAAASLLMGQAAQKKPVVIIKGYKFNQNQLCDSQSLIRGEEEDFQWY